MDSIIKIKNLNGGYKNRIILNNTCLQIKPGTMTAIVGPNGSGKSTLLKYLIKELQTDNKVIFLSGKDINKYSQIELSEKISYVTQNTKQEYEFTVQELVALGRYNHNDISIENKKVINTLDTVGIHEIKDKKITEISGGELQLAMLARAICQDSTVMLLDEPTNNLDPKHQHKIMKLLAKLKEQNKTIICVIHDLNLVLQYFENTILLKEGQIMATGVTNEVISKENIKSAFDIDVEIRPSHDRLPSTVYYIP